MASWLFHMPSLLVLCLSHVANGLEHSKPPNILFILADDLGWFDVGYHNPKILTPNIDELAKSGVILNSYYVQSLCTPTRAALMTGRYPIHTGLQHSVIHPDDVYGLPLDFELLPQKLREAGYATHLVGKWHLGFYKSPYLPTNRGFDTAYGCLGGGTDHFDHTRNGVVDFHDNLEPVKNLNGTYATNAYVNRVKQIVQSHDPSQPLFIYMAFQNVHTPIQAPEGNVEKYNFIKKETRRTLVGMVDIMDEAVGNITDAFKSAGLWDNTVLIFSTDNGGLPYYGGYNWPLRGGKQTLWEGGVRGFGFVHSNLLARKGITCNELLHVTDWYPTLLGLAAVTSEDKSPIPQDGYDVWDTISLGTPSPRTEILHNIDPPGSAGPRAQGIYIGSALRMGDWKLLMDVPNITWFMPPEIGGTAKWEMPLDAEFFTPEDNFNRLDVELYNIAEDPEERVDLSETFPDIVRMMRIRLKHYMRSLEKPLNTRPDPEALKTAQKNGIWGPWKD